MTTPHRRATDLPEDDDPLAFWPGLFWALGLSAASIAGAVLLVDAIAQRLA
jgi:hypothetical protein